MSHTLVITKFPTKQRGEHLFYGKLRVLSTTSAPLLISVVLCLAL